MYKTKPEHEARYVEKSGRTRKAEWAQCLSCELWFAGRLGKSSAQKFCTTSCMKDHLKRLNTLVLQCAYCNKDFEKTKGTIKNRRTKTDYTFCSRRCKDDAQRLTSDFADLRPSHYGTGIFNYRVTAGVETGKCVDCNISSPGFLQVHHKDGNRNNNVPENLEIVCFNHHAVRHMRRDADGLWRHNSHALTPQDMIPELIQMLSC